MPDQVKPPAIKPHTVSEVSHARTYLDLYKNQYNTPDLSDGGIIRMLVGYRNYLDTLPTGSMVQGGSVAPLLTGGFF